MLFTPQQTKQSLTTNNETDSFFVPGQQICFQINHKNVISVLQPQIVLPAISKQSFLECKSYHSEYKLFF